MYATCMYLRDTLQLFLCAILVSLVKKDLSELFQSRPDCVLPCVVERLVLPRLLLTPGKPPPPHLLTAIRKHLPQVSWLTFCINISDLDLDSAMFYLLHVQ